MSSYNCITCNSLYIYKNFSQIRCNFIPILRFKITRLSSVIYWKKIESSCLYLQSAYFYVYGWRLSVNGYFCRSKNIFYSGSWIRKFSKNREPYRTSQLPSIFIGSLTFYAGNERKIFHLGARMQILFR